MMMNPVWSILFSNLVRKYTAGVAMVLPRGRLGLYPEDGAEWKLLF